MYAMGGLLTVPVLVFLRCYVQYPRSVLSRSSTRLTRDNPPPPHISLVSDISQLKVLAATSYSAQSHVLRVCCFSSGMDDSETTILRGNMAKCRYLLKKHSSTLKLHSLCSYQHIKFVECLLQLNPEYFVFLSKKKT
jgi:hypothetical protein